MIEAIKNDELAKRIGGAFRLTAMVQRRLKELIEGSRPLVDPQGKTLIEIAIQEIDEGKVVIDYEKTEMLTAIEEDTPKKE